MATGHLPNRFAARVFRLLDDHAEQTERGGAYADRMGFAVPKLPSGRESFSSETSYYTGPVPMNPMGFVQGASTLAADVRSENHYGPAAENAKAAKRADDFQAGTLVGWDVDRIAQGIRSFRADRPMEPVIFLPGSEANAEPAVPGWRILVERVFP